MRSCRLEALAGVAAGDIDHEPQIGPDHAVAGAGVAEADGWCQVLLVACREQGRFVDLAEVGFQRSLNGGGGFASRCGHKSKLGRE